MFSPQNFKKQTLFLYKNWISQKSKWLQTNVILSVLSKFLERYVHKHLVTYLETRDLFHRLQSGFRRKHSCNTTLGRITDSRLSAINRSVLSGGVFLDLKKAFDRVDQRIFPSKLSVYLNGLNSLLFSVHTLKIEYNLSLSVALAILRELLNVVCHKGQPWGVYSSAFML